MPEAHDYYPDCPEALIVSLARTGDRSAFAELVQRRQSSVRNLMRRCCGDVTLADDLAQQVFLKVWLKIRQLREASAFGSWLKRLAISVWLQHIRRKDPLRGADEPEDARLSNTESTGLSIDLDAALSTLSNTIRLCVVLSYHEGMSHSEITKCTDIPLGTVKSNIKRGSAHLQRILSAYSDEAVAEIS